MRDLLRLGGLGHGGGRRADAGAWSPPFAGAVSSACCRLHCRQGQRQNAAAGQSGAGGTSPAPVQLAQDSPQPRPRPAGCRKSCARSAPTASGCSRASPSLERNLEDVTGSIKRQAARSCTGDGAVPPRLRRALRLTRPAPPPCRRPWQPQRASGAARRRPQSRAWLPSPSREPSTNRRDRATSPRRRHRRRGQFRRAARALEFDQRQTHAACSTDCTRSWSCARTARPAPPSCG